MYNVGLDSTYDVTYPSTQILHSECQEHGGSCHHRGLLPYKLVVLQSALTNVSSQGVRLHGRI